MPPATLSLQPTTMFCEDRPWRALGAKSLDSSCSQALDLLTTDKMFKCADELLMQDLALLEERDAEWVSGGVSQRLKGELTSHHIWSVHVAWQNPLSRTTACCPRLAHRPRQTAITACDRDTLLILKSAHTAPHCLLGARSRPGRRLIKPNAIKC